MDKKIIMTVFTAFGLAAFGNLLLNQSSFAEGLSVPKTWSYAEAKEIYEEFDTKRNAACGNDRTCRRNYLNELKRQDSKYGVVDAYIKGALLITTINPDDDYIKAVYRNFDFATYERTGRESYRDLTELYICWLDPDFEVWQFSANLRQGNELPGLHPMIRMSATINDGAGLPFRANEEMPLPYTGTHLRDNAKQNLYYSAWMNYSNYTSNSDYSTCTSSPDYVAGLGCQLRFKEDGSTIYLPQVKIPEKNQGNITSVETPTDSLETQEPHWEDPNEKPIHYPTTTDNNLVQEAGQKTTTNEIPQNIPSAPETGTKTMRHVANREEEPILPWWLVVLVIIGCTTFLSFFGSKSPKNRKKSLDKKNSVR